LLDYGRLALRGRTSPWEAMRLLARNPDYTH